MNDENTRAFVVHLPFIGNRLLRRLPNQQQTATTALLSKIRFGFRLDFFGHQLNTVNNTAALQTILASFFTLLSYFFLLYLNTASSKPCLISHHLWWGHSFRGRHFY
jgi:hypothetical protein